MKEMRAMSTDAKISMPWRRRSSWDRSGRAPISARRSTMRTTAPLRPVRGGVSTSDAPMPRWYGRGHASRGLDRRCELGALADGALGVELCRDVCAADDVHLHPGGGERGTERVHGLLAGAEHDRVDGEDLRVGVVLAVGDVEPLVVDALVVDADVVMDSLGLQGRPVHPTGRLAEAPPDGGGLALEQVHLPRRG